MVTAGELGQTAILVYAVGALVISARLGNRVCRRLERLDQSIQDMTTTIMAKFDRLEAMLDSMLERLDSMLNKLDSNLDRLESRLDTLDSALDKIIDSAPPRSEGKA